MLTRRDVVLGSTLAATAALADTASGRQRKPTMAHAAAALLAALDAEQKQKAQLPFNSEERFVWHYVPMERQGLRYKNMTSEQQKLAQTLLLLGLSKTGFRKIEAIRQLEYVLRDIEKGSGPTRDPDLYYFTIFGDPDPKGTWGWRYEGHHVSLHWTCLKGKIIASSPQFLGSNPAEVRSGPQKGTRVLAAEEDLGRALVKSLDAAQRKEAIVSAKAPGDILSAASRKAELLDDRGIPYRQLNKEQQGLLLTLLEEYANVQVQEIAQQRLEAVRKAGMDTIKFAWMGGIDKGEPHYYRVQSATFLVEYDNTQNDANHIHTVWRDFKGDFGVDLLALHYHTADHDHGHDV